MAQRARIPLMLLTGFLGSGKTSLLSQWLRAPAFANSMVIVNELGEVGLDDRLVQFSSEAPVVLENGCACCEAAEDLNASLERLFWARLHRQIPRFEWMLIETTGIADPAPILASLARNELVAERYRLAGVVTTFDARRGPTQMADHPECRSQVIQADALVLTKMDLATPSQARNARAAVMSVRPDVRILESAGSNLAADIVAQALAAASPKAAAGDTIAAHSDDVSSAFAPLPKPVDEANLHTAIRAMFARYGKRILRLKGLVHINGTALPQALQASDEEFQLSPLHKVSEGGKAGLTFISQFVPAEHIARDFLSVLPEAPTDAALPAFSQRARG